MKPGWLTIGLYDPIQSDGPEHAQIVFRPVRVDDVRLVDEGKVTSQFAVMSMLTSPKVSPEALSMLTYPADLPRVMALFMSHIPVELRDALMKLPSFDEGFDPKASSAMVEDDAAPKPSKSLKGQASGFDPYPASLDDAPVMDETLPHIPGTMPQGTGDFDLSE
jgi:hypothetical protein